jgi:hypothetical protein
MSTATGPAPPEGGARGRPSRLTDSAFWFVPTPGGSSSIVRWVTSRRLPPGSPAEMARGPSMEKRVVALSWADHGPVRVPRPPSRLRLAADLPGRSPRSPSQAASSLRVP